MRRLTLHAVTAPTANVIGLGLIGGSIALGLSRAGWTVHGTDHNPDTVGAATAAGAIIAGDLATHADITFVAVPVSAIPTAVREALATTTGTVTDVGSVKAAVVSEVADPRFIGGHPMAGSELDGFAAADPDLFRGAVWALTPHPDTDDAALSGLTAAIGSLGAEPIALNAVQHDRVVATVSHVPHLTAATMMSVASNRAVEQQALLRLAAGGFRDMTRIASGSPSLWVDICTQNSVAIVEALDEMIGALDRMRTALIDGDTDRVEQTLSQARDARRHLPGRVLDPDNLVEVRIPIPDRSGAAAELFTIAADLGVNIANFEVVHSAEGDRGIAVFDVDAEAAERFGAGLRERGYRPSVAVLE